MVSLARKNLFHDRLRFVITVAGVAFAVTLVLVQVGLFMGLLDKATVTIEHASAEVWITSHNTPNVDFAHTFPETAVLRARGVPGVARAENLLIQFMNIQLPNGAEEGALVYAMGDFGGWNLPWEVNEGDVRDLKRGAYILMDRSASRRFGPFAVGDYREILGKRFKIIGTTSGAASFTTAPIVFMDFKNAQELLQTVQGKTHYVLVALEPGADAEAVATEIRRRLPFNDVYTKAEWAARTRNYWIKNTGIGFNAFLTVFLGCLVGIVVVAQTLYTSTMEHLKEFGTVKAIGGSNRDIYGILARQAGVSAVVGFVLGLIPSFAIRPLVERGDLKLILPTELTVVVFVGTVVLCLVAAMISFRKVASIDPGLVFRT